MILPKEKAEQLVNKYRMILMNEDTDCGNEILCTVIAKKCAITHIDEMIIHNGDLWLEEKINKNDYQIINGYLFDVKDEIELL